MVVARVMITLGMDIRRIRMKRICMNGLAVLAIGALLMGCASSGQTVHTKRDAVIGSGLGAVVGGVIGTQSGRGLEGAAIGAAAGALGGAAVGSSRDEAESTYNTPQPAY
jgi:hypothetical protein